jgi:hypothetical protein
MIGHALLEKRLSHNFSNGFHLGLNGFGDLGQVINFSIYLIDFNVGIPRHEQQRRANADQQKIHFFTGRQRSRTFSWPDTMACPASLCKTPEPTTGAGAPAGVAPERITRSCDGLWSGSMPVSKQPAGQRRSRYSTSTISSISTG